MHTSQANGGTRAPPRPPLATLLRARLVLRLSTEQENEKKNVRENSRIYKPNNVIMALSILHKETNDGLKSEVKKKRRKESFGKKERAERFGAPKCGDAPAFKEMGQICEDRLQSLLLFYLL